MVGKGFICVVTHTQLHKLFEAVAPIIKKYFLSYTVASNLIIRCYYCYYGCVQDFLIRFIQRLGIFRNKEVNTMASDADALAIFVARTSKAMILNMRNIRLLTIHVYRFPLPVPYQG